MPLEILRFRSSHIDDFTSADTRLLTQVTTANLERVRKVKTRHQRLYTRVQTVREELQRFLEDDDDMMKMCLTRKKELEQMAGKHPSNLHLTTSKVH